MQRTLVATLIPTQRSTVISLPSKYLLQTRYNIIVTTCRWSINLFTYPNPVCGHSYKWQYVSCFLRQNVKTQTHIYEYSFIVIRFQPINVLISDSLIVTYFLCYSIQLAFQRIEREREGNNKCHSTYVSLGAQNCPKTQQAVAALVGSKHGFATK
jgi:hypothetical protein